MFDARHYIRGVIVCMFVALVSTGAACAQNSGTEDPQSGVGASGSEVTFAGALVYVDGEQAFSLDGATGEPDKLFELEGELGWSGFARLTSDGGLVYESLRDGSPSIHLGSVENGDSVLVSNVTFVHDFDGQQMLITDASDTHVLQPGKDTGAPRALGIGATLAAAISADGSEFAYASIVPTDTPETELGELEQMLGIGTLDGTEPGTEIARGWHAIEPILIDDEVVLYTAYPFGGGETGDLVLFDRRSEESTALATGVRVLDRDPKGMTVAVAFAALGGPDSDSVATIDVRDPDAVDMTVFESGAGESVTAARLLPGNAGLVAAFAQEDGASTLVAFDARDGSQRTVAEIPDTTISEILAHPVDQVAFLVLQGGGPDPESITRSMVACDLAEGETSTLVNGSEASLLHLIGVYDD